MSAESEGLDSGKAGRFMDIATQAANLVARKNAAYGNSFEVAAEQWHARLHKYDTGDGHYKIPKSLVSLMLTIVRIDDKINRIVSNPDVDKMDESPFSDILGYALLEIEKAERKDQGE